MLTPRLRARQLPAPIDIADQDRRRLHQQTFQADLPTLLLRYAGQPQPAGGQPVHCRGKSAAANHQAGLRLWCRGRERGNTGSKCGTRRRIAHQGGDLLHLCYHRRRAGGVGQGDQPDPQPCRQCDALRIMAHGQHQIRPLFDDLAQLPRIGGKSTRLPGQRAFLFVSAKPADACDLARARSEQQIFIRAQVEADDARRGGGTHCPRSHAGKGQHPPRRKRPSRGQRHALLNGGCSPAPV